MTARHWFADRMTEAGLNAEIDGIGNVIGRAPRDGPQLLLGSHLETQPHAGWLDGAMGVIYGLEVARTLGHGIEVGAWADEEGHFGNFLGSRSFVRRDRRGGDRAHRQSPRRRNTGGRAGPCGAGRAAARAARSGALPRLPGGAYRAGRRARHLGSAPRRGHQHRRHLAVPHPFRGRAEPRRHHAHGDPQRCRRGAGAAGGRDRGALPRRSAARAACGPPGASCWTPARPASFPGAAEMLFQFRDADPGAPRGDGAGAGGAGGRGQHAVPAPSR